MTETIPQQNRIGIIGDGGNFFGFPFWELHLNKDGGIDSSLAERLNSLNHQAQSTDFPIKDLVILIHGLNNTRDDAKSIYTSYMTEIANVAVQQGAPVSQIGVLGIYWPSILKLTEPKTIPSDAVLGGHGVTESLQGILRANSGLRLHLAAHSLGTVVLASTLNRLVQDGFGNRVGSVFLIQGAVQSGWFSGSGPLANAKDHIAGPIIATSSQQDLLMKAADFAMSAETKARISISALQGLLTILEKVTPFKPRESFPDQTWWLDQGYDAFRKYLGSINFSAPAAIHGLAGSQWIDLHRPFDDAAECGHRRYPFNGGQKGVYTLRGDHAICGHDEYKIKDVAFAHLVATGLVVSPSAPRRASPYPTQRLSPDTWMADLWPTISKRPLKHLSLPGSHDAGSSACEAIYPTHLKDAISGAYVKRYITSYKVGKIADSAATGVKTTFQKIGKLFSDDGTPVDNRSALEIEGGKFVSGLVNPVLPLFKERIGALSKTQDRTIGKQLEAGARYFDIRPVVHGGTFHLAHIDHQKIIRDYTESEASYIGAVGEKLETVLKDVASFASEQKHSRELIILTFSHFCDLDRQSHHKQESYFTSQQFHDLAALITRMLDAHVIISNDPYIRLDEIPLEQLVAGGRTVLCVFDESNCNGVHLPLNTTKGLYRWGKADERDNQPVSLKVFDEYSDDPRIASSIGKQLRKFQDFSQAGRRGLFLLSWTITMNNTDPLTAAFGDIQGNALGMNRALLPTINDWISAGVITPDKIPNVLYHDFVGADIPSAPTELMAVIQRLNTLS